MFQGPNPMTKEYQNTTSGSDSTEAALQSLYSNQIQCPSRLSMYLSQFSWNVVQLQIGEV